MTRINVPHLDSDGEQTKLGWFDTDTSEQVQGRREWDGNNMADVHAGANRGQNLYRTSGGRFVLEEWSSWVTEQTSYTFVTSEKAREWLIFNESDEEVKDWFGELEEEAGPGRGRPEVGPLTSMRLGEALTAEIDAARTPGESRAAAIRRLLSSALHGRDLA